MNNYDIIVLLIAVFFHELTHYVYDWIYVGRRPKINFKYLGLLIEIPIDNEKYTIYHKENNHLFGCIAGMTILLAVSTRSEMILLYIIICSVDIVAVISLFECMDKYKISSDTKVIDIPCDRCIKYGVN